MKITVTYEVNEEMMKELDEILEYYEPSDFEHQDDREVFLADIANVLIDFYPPLSLEEAISHIVEEYLKKKGWIKNENL